MSACPTCAARKEANGYRQTLKSLTDYATDPMLTIIVGEEGFALMDRIDTLRAERDAARAEVAALCASRDRLLSAVDEALHCDGGWWTALARAAERERKS
jgi:hypothetical protein